MEALQLDAFGPPIARKRDPETSIEAANEYDGNARDADKQALLSIIRQKPGHTAGEYAQLLFDRGMDFYKAARMPTKRVSDLLHDGLIRAGEARKCRKTGRNARTYYDV